MAFGIAKGAWAVQGAVPQLQLTGSCCCSSSVWLCSLPGVQPARAGWLRCSGLVDNTGDGFLCWQLPGEDPAARRSRCCSVLVWCPGFHGGIPVCRSGERRGFGLLGWERSKKAIKAPSALGCSQRPPRGGCKVFLNPLCASERSACISSSDR